MSSRPSPQYSVGVNAGSYTSGGRPSMQGSTAGDAAALSGGGRGNNFISRNYGQSGTHGESFFLLCVPSKGHTGSLISKYRHNDQ